MTLMPMSCWPDMTYSAGGSSFSPTGESMVGGNLDGYALDELLARLCADVGLNLDGLAAVDFVAVERDAVERGGAARVNGGDVERDGAEFDALEAARKKRLHGSGDRARGVDASARHREAAFERDRLLTLDLNLAAHADC